jgi:sulfite reductase (ferredoxin)
MSNIKTVNSFYKLPREVIEDVSSYRAEVDRFINGEFSAERFRPFRVTRGVYSQRGQKTFMVRIKVPAGGLLPEQMVRISELASRYANGIPHVTSRQDVQLHWVKIEDTPKVMEGLTEVGLTTKGGGGNTVRNVTACADSGVCSSEAFEVAPYAVALTEYFLRHPKGDTLPRKYKIAFSGCSDDCALATVNDVGFIATRDRKGNEGFRVYVAGGMGAWSRVATLLEEFVPAKDAARVADAILEVFHKHGNRRNKHKARLRFLFEKLGPEEFKRLYREEFERLKKDVSKDVSTRPVPMLRDVQSSAGAKAPEGADTSGFDGWFASNTRPQRQDGYYYANIKIPLGDITSDKLKALADVAGDFGEGTIRTTQDQNVIMRWLRREELEALYVRLREIGLDAALEGVAGGVDDVVSCPGAATCNLGICLSKNLATELSRELRESGLSLGDVRDVDIKVSGCPNSCGQHPIGSVGFFGAARSKDGRTAPHYSVLLGGRVKEGHTRLATEVGFVPSRSVPKVVKEFLGCYLEKSPSDESFHTYLEKSGFEDMKRIVLENSTLPAYEEDRAFYRDWGATEDFSLAGLGPGECGAGVFDMIETDLKDARTHLESARELLEGKTGNPSSDLFKALAFATKALLITHGVEPTNEPEAIKEFEKNFVEKGYVPEKFKALEMRGELFRSGHLNEEGLRQGISLVDELLTTVNRLYESMDDTMRFADTEEKKEALEAEETKKEGEKEKTEEVGPEEGKGADVVMDLRGIKCPINYVKAKIRLETMQKGQTLFMYLDEGEPIRNVPSSLKNDGQEILEMEKTGEYYELLVRKAV